MPQSSLSVLCFTAALLAPASASAFCRTTTARKVTDNTPTSTAGCRTDGVPIWWRNTCIGYSIQGSGSKKLTYDEVATAMADAYFSWSGTYCSNSDQSLVATITVKDLGPVNCGQIAYHPNGSNQNVVVFRDDFWPYDDPEKATLALTTVNFDTTTGEIKDADMEINTADHDFSTGDPVDPDKFDLLSVVTHEAGHFLGLAHSAEPTAVMYAREPPGTSNMRQLTSDDVDAICTVYRPDGRRALSPPDVVPVVTTDPGPCDPTPTGGFSENCDSGVAKSGCAIGGGPTSPVGVLAFAGVVFAGLAIGRRTA
jgi:hypothetical protein